MGTREEVPYGGLLQGGCIGVPGVLCLFIGICVGMDLLLVFESVVGEVVKSFVELANLSLPPSTRLA